MNMEEKDFLVSAFPMFSLAEASKLSTDVPLLTVIARGSRCAKGHAILVMEYLKKGNNNITAVNVVPDLVATTKEGKHPRREQIDSKDETLGILIRNVESKAGEGDTPKDHVAWKILPSKEQESAEIEQIYGTEAPDAIEKEILAKVKETHTYHAKNGYSYKPVNDRINCIVYVYQLLKLAGIKLSEKYKNGTAWDIVQGVKEYKQNTPKPKL